jgi:hypothetical protein
LLPTSTSSPGVPTMNFVVPGCWQVRGTTGGGVGVGLEGTAPVLVGGTASTGGGSVGGT